MCIAIISYKCTFIKKNKYENIDNKNATYIGMDKCRNCHEPIYQTYIKTGMGQSWGLATKQKSIANFDKDKALVHDAKNNLWYKPYWLNDSLHILEYRLNGKDTIHKRDETIKYIIGSGQHTNSHIYEINGYLHQAPITFYTQKGVWDLAPGNEKENTRFERKIEAECITCHNGYPEQVAGSLNKYTAVKQGIDCERCHGPGSLHVNGILNGAIKDTSKTADYRIVNPRRLSIEQQNNLCQRCHLQGVSVLNDGASFFDFEPSHNLSEHWNVFMPEFKNKNQHMIMASHVERMKMSKCFIKSKRMSCITCHNPHITVKETPAATFNNACKQCHTQKGCTQNLTIRNKNGDDCSGCHMAKNSSIDIPHVAVHDHYIRKNIQEKEPDLKDNFLGLFCYSNDNLDATTIGRGYIEFFERFQNENKNLLDSALYYIQKGGKQKQLNFKDELRIYFLKEDYQKVIALANKDEQKITDAWTAYRIGEAYYKLAMPLLAQKYFNKAVDLMPLNLDFLNKQAECYNATNKQNEAKEIYLKITQENPKHAKANSNLGFIFLQEGNITQAEKYIKNAVMLDPNNIQAMINLAVTYYQQKNTKQILPLLKNALALDPANMQIQAMVKDLNKK